MGSLKNKRLAYKLTIILAIILMVCVFVSLLFGFLQTNATRNSYYTQTQAEAQYLSHDIYSKLSLTNGIAINTDSLTIIPAEYWDDVSYIIFANGNEASEEDSAGTDNTDNDPDNNQDNNPDQDGDPDNDTTIVRNNANMVSPDAATQIRLNDAAFAKIKAETASITNGVYSDLFALSKLVVGISDKTTVYLAARKVQDEYIIVLRDVSKLFADISYYGFDTIRLYSSDITYSVSNTDTVLSQNFYGKLDNNTKQLLAHPDSFTTTLKTDGSKAVFALCPTSANSTIRVSAGKASTVLDDAIRMQVRHLAIEDVSITAMFLLGFVLLLLLLVKDEGDFQFLNIRNGNFAIKVTSKGKIIWHNNNFGAKFDCDNINEKIDSKDKIAYVLSLGKPVVLHLEDKNGDEHYLLMSIIRYGIRYRLVGSDLTGPVSTYYSLLHKDKFDSVTDLLQEWVFINKVPSVIETGKGIKGSLALIRLTNLKMLKIMLGEHLYRQLLMLYSAGLKRELDSFGELYVLKNGDFLLLTTDEHTTNTLINKISVTMERLRSPIKLNDNSIQLDAKLGVIVLNSNDINITANSLLSNAQRALEYAINSPKQNYYVLYPTSFSVSRTNFRADGVVKSMVDNGEIEVYFQPQVSLKSNKIVGFEALCRIVGQKSTEINVGDFISIAEQYGGMIELGNYICDKAMSFAAEIGAKDMQIAVNVSPIQLMQAGFTDTFLAMYKKHNIKSGILNIEITESAALYSFEEAVAKLTIIRNNGIGVHIDDFGVAYSSMLHLKLLPATLIKIDKSLVDDITNKADARSIIKNIINLGKDLGLETIAEGVETHSQMDLLRDLSCDMVQGFVISKAVPARQAKELIEIMNTDKDDKGSE